MQCDLILACGLAMVGLTVVTCTGGEEAKPDAPKERWLVYEFSDGTIISVDVALPQFAVSLPGKETIVAKAYIPEAAGDLYWRKTWPPVSQGQTEFDIEEYDYKELISRGLKSVGERNLERKGEESWTETTVAAAVTPDPKMKWKFTLSRNATPERETALRMEDLKRRLGQVKGEQTGSDFSYPPSAPSTESHWGRYLRRLNKDMRNKNYYDELQEERLALGRRQFGTPLYTVKFTLEKVSTFRKKSTEDVGPLGLVRGTEDTEPLWLDSPNWQRVWSATGDDTGNGPFLKNVRKDGRPHFVRG